MSKIKLSRILPADADALIDATEEALLSIRHGLNPSSIAKVLMLGTEEL